MTPSPTLFGRSAYTVLGGVGYVAAVAVATILAIAWQLTLGERLVTVLAPPLAFIAVTTIATALKGGEWVVFYQTAAGAIATTMIAGLVIGANLPRLADVVVIGIGTFLVFGRIGCFHVACCHGRPARSGVHYDERHVGLGLWSACADRPLWPVQLFEAGGTALVVGGALLAAAEPGRAACIFAVGYATIRFLLELLRGDPVRPVLVGISEAQWWCVATAVACVVVRPVGWTIAAATLLGQKVLKISEHPEIVLRTHAGTLAGELLGDNMTNLFDLDGDGVDEYAIGAFGNVSSLPSTGAIIVYSGRTGAELQRLEGESPNLFFGQQTVADLGNGSLYAVDVYFPDPGTGRSIGRVVLFRAVPVTE